MALDPSPRAIRIGSERGCVEDQPQRVGSSKASGACSVLRLVEDDTAALRVASPQRPNSQSPAGAIAPPKKLRGFRKIGEGFFFQAEDGIRDRDVTGVQTCALPI